MAYRKIRQVDAQGNTIAPETIGEQVIMADGENLEQKLHNFTPGGGGGTSVDVVQTTGNSKTAVMSQDAVTKAIEVRGNNYIIRDGAYTLKEAIDFLAAQMHFADKDIVCGMTITFVLKGAEGQYNAGRTYQLTAYQATGHLDNYFPPESWKEVALLTYDLGYSEHLAASQKMVTNLIEVRGNNYTIKDRRPYTLQEAITKLANEMNFTNEDIVAGMTITFVTYNAEFDTMGTASSAARTYQLTTYYATGQLETYNNLNSWKEVALLTTELGDSDSLAPTQKLLKTELAKKAGNTDIPTKLMQLTEDATHRLVTDEEKEKWNEGIAQIGTIGTTLDTINGEVI